MQLAGVMTARAQPVGASPLGRPTGLTSLKHGGVLGRPRLNARRSTAVRAQLDGFERAANYAADSLPSWMDTLAAHLTTSMYLLADVTPDSLLNAPLPGDVDPAAAADVAAEVVDKNGGFFGFFSSTFEAFLKVLDGGLEKLGIPYSYGFAIILVTLLVKVGTYPLTKKQVESTLALQALQPRVKELQAKYAGDAERLQVETAKLYQTAGVNPLAGCLPTLVTIPVFIGLYRALSNVADEGLLGEGFFWIPSLAGPTKLNGGLSWLLPVDGGAPELGWGPTIAYLVLPVLLVISQYLSMKVISPPQNNTDPSQQQANAILKFMPLMIGWFSLNVPSGLTLYWFANNILTTAQQAYLRSKFQAPELAGGPTGTIVKPPVVEEEDKRPTGKELNSRRSPKQLDTSTSQSAADASSGEKFRAIKAREAAKKAAQEAAKSGGGSGKVAGAGGAAAPSGRGSKFAEIKAREAAAKAAAAAPAEGQASSSNGSSRAGEAAVAVAVEAEVVGQETQHVQRVVEEEEGGQVIAEVHSVQGAAGAESSKDGGAKKGSKKGGKRK